MSKLSRTASEDVLSAKTDLCLSNAIVKAGTALGVGVIASAILFKRRPWPVLLGLGFGAGQGYSDCERVFNPAAVPGFTIVSPVNPAAVPGFTIVSPPAPSASLSPASPSVFNSLKQEIVKDVAIVKEQLIGTATKVENKLLAEEHDLVAVVKAEEKKWV